MSWMKEAEDGVAMQVKAAPKLTKNEVAAFGVTLYIQICFILSFDLSILMYRIKANVRTGTANI